MKKVSLYFIILSFFLIYPQVGLAAGFDIINLTTIPKTPGANEKVTVRMESYTTNLGTANIAWYVNREKVADGVALREVVVETLDFGNITTIDIVIVLASGERLDKQLVIAPAEVDMLWEAQTFTPPFYKGKALPSFKSLIRVSAIPRFNTMTSEPKKYHYKWSYNRNLGLGEALGMNSVVVPMGYANTPLPVDVTVSLPGTAWVGSKHLSIPGTEAKVVLYQQDPLLGIQFNNAWTGIINTSDSEFVAYAVPFFFSLDDIVNNRIVYRWEVNRQYTQPGLDARYLTIPSPLPRDADGIFKKNTTPAPVTVSFKAQNPVRILQEGRAQSTVTFNP